MKHLYLENMHLENAFKKTYPTYSVVNIQILKTSLESFACLFFLMSTSLWEFVESFSSWLYDENIDSFPKVTQNIPCKLGHYECGFLCHRVIRGNVIDYIYSACLCCLCKLISICSVLPCQKWYKNWQLILPNFVIKVYLKHQPHIMMTAMETGLTKMHQKDPAIILIRTRAWHCFKQRVSQWDFYSDTVSNCT